MQLVIGNKNHSSWSLRPWLLLRQAHLTFEEVRIPLYQPDTRSRLTHYSSWGRVPVLIDGGVTVWESLAICEYVAETYPECGLWPNDRAARAMARSVSAEMHAGFNNLRQELSMDCRAQHASFPLTEPTRRELDRIEAIWGECRSRFAGQGPFLFGRFSVADAMYAPIAVRGHTYSISWSDESARYAATLLALPDLKTWVTEARAESERLPQFERRPGIQR
ncbi:MAG: glutathione S-transferase family protein [Acidiferrobacteraceae bacterium]